MTITLTGYRGTGKSSVAPLLADRLGWSWIDADAEIERRAGQSIRDIFAAGGEPEFRRQERAVMVDLLSRDRLVIASGGGAILNEQTRRDMRAAGRSSGSRHRSTPSWPEWAPTKRPPAADRP